MEDKQNSSPKHKRVVVYVSEEEYNQLRAKLILMHKTVSQWVREKIRHFNENY